MPWRVQLGRVRHRLWIVVLMTVLALAGGGASILTAHPDYSEKAALTAMSQTRSPDQDAILAQGYVNFFNDPSYQATLRQRADVASDVTFEAQTAAGSPLIYIIATSSSESDVRTAASKMATALLDTVNDALREARDDTIARVRKPYDDARAADGAIPAAAQQQMAYQISLLNSNTTNQLSKLELQSGVTATSSNVPKVMGLSLVAGLALGISAALAAGALSLRIESATELAAKVSVPVLAVIPRASAAQQGERYGQLVNALDGIGDRPAVVAVSSPRGLAATASVARAIATHQADKGRRVILLDVDLPTTADDARPSRHIPQADAIDVDALLSTHGSHTGDIIEIGRGSDHGPIETLSVGRFERFLAVLRERSDLVVLMTSPIVESANAQLACVAADTTLLVVEQMRTRTADIERARQLVDQVNGEIAGVVLVERGAARGQQRGGDSRGAAGPSIEGVVPDPIDADVSTPKRVPGPKRGTQARLLWGSEDGVDSSQAGCDPEDVSSPSATSHF
jgi:Mrp family chromosome partitioning ATPase